MAKGKKSNNGNRMNNMQRAGDRQKVDPSKSPVNPSVPRKNIPSSSNSAVKRNVPQGKKNPRAQMNSVPRANPEGRNVSSKTAPSKNAPAKNISAMPKKGVSANLKMKQKGKAPTVVRRNAPNTQNPNPASSNNSLKADPVAPQFRRPLFGDEQEPTTTVVEKEAPKVQPKKLSWWKVRQIDKRNQLIQKQKLEKEKEEAAKKEQQIVPDVLEETRPEVGEERRKHMAKMRKRDSLRAAFNAFLSILILTGMMIIAVLYVEDYVSAKPTYAFATQGTIEHTIGANALVVRNESVINSTHTGALLAQATEGSRVAKNQLLALVIPDGMESTLTDLQNVEQQIVDIERQLMNQGKGVAAKAIFTETNEEIHPIITTIRQDALLNNLNNMTSYSSSIRVLMEKRDTNLKDIDFEDEQLNTLRNSESNLQTQLKNRANSISANEPGIVSYKLDGQEEIITLDLLMNMVDTKCEQLIKDSSSIITGDLQIKQNEPVLRIVQNDEQYFACLLKNASMDEFKEDSVHVIRIPSEAISIADCIVIRCAVTRDGLMVVFKTSNQVERLLDRRTVDIEIVQTSTSGIRVPVSSLADADYDRGIATIYVNESGYAKGYTVQVKDYDREYAIIAPIDDKQTVPSISTIVITNPSTVKEGDKVEK